MSTDVATRPMGSLEALQKLFAAKRPNLEDILPDPKRVVSLTKAIVTQASRVPRLLECTTESLYTAAIQCASLNLEPGPFDHVYLIPRRNNVNRDGAPECNVDIGYKGYLELAERHAGVLKRPEGFLVYQEEPFDYDPVMGEVKYKWLGDEVDRSDAKIRYGFVVMRLRDCPDYPVFHVMTRTQIEKRRARSEAKKGPWETDYPEMALKTVIRDMAHRGKMPMTPQLAEAVNREVMREVEAIEPAEVRVTDVEDPFKTEPTTNPKQVEGPEPTRRSKPNNGRRKKQTEEKPAPTEGAKGDNFGLGDPRNSDDSLRKQLQELPALKGLDETDFHMAISTALGRAVMDWDTLDRGELVKAIKVLAK